MGREVSVEVTITVCGPVVPSVADFVMIDVTTGGVLVLLLVVEVSELVEGILVVLVVDGCVVVVLEVVGDEVDDVEVEDEEDEEEDVVEEDGVGSDGVGVSAGVVVGVSAVGVAASAVVAAGAATRGSACHSTISRIWKMQNNAITQIIWKRFHHTC